jgi:hypothetical protein
VKRVYLSILSELHLGFPLHRTRDALSRALKQKNRYHNDEFYKLLYKFIPPEKVKIIQGQIIGELYNIITNAKQKHLANQEI